MQLSHTIQATHTNLVPIPLACRVPNHDDLGIVTDKAASLTRWDLTSGGSSPQLVVPFL